MSTSGQLPVVVIGAGPVGLAAAAHLHERELPFIVLEAGDTASAAVRMEDHAGAYSLPSTTPTIRPLPLPR